MRSISCKLSIFRNRAKSIFHNTVINFRTKVNKKRRKLCLAFAIWLNTTQQFFFKSKTNKRMKQYCATEYWRATNKYYLTNFKGKMHGQSNLSDNE